MAEYWLERQQNSIIDFLNFVSARDFPMSKNVKFILLTSSKNLLVLFREWLPYKYSLESLNIVDNFHTYRLKKEIKRSGEIYYKSGIFYLFRYEQTNMYVIVTLEKQDFVNTILFPFVNSKYSEIAKIHLSSKQIKEILGVLKEELDLDGIRTYWALMKGILDNKITKFGTKDKESISKHTDEPYLDTFRRAAERNEWVDKIYFYAKKNFDRIFKASIARNGLFQCENLVAIDFYNVVVKSLLRISNKNFKVFKDKSRERNEGEIKPLSIKYDINLFSDDSQNKRFIEMISDFPNSSYSLYHGNPYIHLSLVDYSDGSSYEIWVVTENEVVIIPQFRASINSISRLTEHVFNKFSEGILVEL